MNALSKPPGNEAEPPSLHQDPECNKSSPIYLHNEENFEIPQKGAAVCRHCLEIITLTQINTLGVHTNVGK